MSSAEPVLSHMTVEDRAAPEPHLALDVFFYHPYSYVSVSEVRYADDRLAA